MLLINMKIKEINQIEEIYIIIGKIIIKIIRKDYPLSQKLIIIYMFQAHQKTKTLKIKIKKTKILKGQSKYNIKEYIH